MNSVLRLIPDLFPSASILVENSQSPKPHKRSCPKSGTAATFHASQILFSSNFTPSLESLKPTGYLFPLPKSFNVPT